MDGSPAAPGNSRPGTRINSVSQEHACPVPTLRWAEGQPGCTFSRGDDGKYRFGLWSGNFGVILAIDSQELEKVRRRILPLVGLQLTVRYRGSDSLDFAASNIVLEFVKHNHDVHGSLDPNDLSKVLQDELDAVADKTNREVRKHPEKKKKSWRKSCKPDKKT